jgi:hypothetical protein
MDGWLDWLSRSPPVQWARGLVARLEALRVGQEDLALQVEDLSRDVTKLLTIVGRRRSWLNVPVGPVREKEG